MRACLVFLHFAMGELGLPNNGNDPPWTTKDNVLEKFGYKDQEAEREIRREIAFSATLRCLPTSS